MTPAEWKRKAIHAGFGLFALTLRWLDWRIAAALRARGPPLQRRSSCRGSVAGSTATRRAARDAGIVAYPAMVLFLILVFSGKYVSIAAAVWAMMAFGDPAAAIVGRTVGRPDASLEPRQDVGRAALELGGRRGGLDRRVSLRDPARARGLGRGHPARSGAAIYAFLESVRAGLDDNIVAAFPTALAVYQMSLHWPPPFLRPGEIGWAPFAVALGVNAAAAGVDGSSPAS